MNCKNYYNKNGFTLIELIVAIVIIAIISTIAVPYAMDFSSKSKLQVCKTNRDTILRLYQYYLVNESNCTLGEYFADNDGEISNIDCPSDGTFTPSGTGISAVITCSVHDEEGVVPDPDPESEPELDIIPYTGGLRVTTTWPNILASNSVNKSETFYYEGAYYVINNSGGGVKSTAHHNVLKINTNKEPINTIGWNSGISRQDFISRFGSISKGDMIYYNMKYYVLESDNPNWMQLPPNNPWTILNGQ